MTQRKKLPPATDWRARNIDDWNVRTVHQYLIDRNRELFGADYVPFGRGPLSNRWRTEQGQLKHAIATYGQALVKAFIDRCLARHKPTVDFPHVNFGFMWAYMRDEMPRAQTALTAETERKQRQEAEEIRSAEMAGEDLAEWF